jgi:hypothetical protein
VHSTCNTKKLRKTYRQNLNDALTCRYGKETNEENLTSSKARATINSKGDTLDRTRGAISHGADRESSGMVSEHEEREQPSFLTQSQTAPPPYTASATSIMAWIKDTAKSVMWVIKRKLDLIFI